MTSEHSDLIQPRTVEREIIWPDAVFADQESGFVGQSTAGTLHRRQTPPVAVATPSKLGVSNHSNNCQGQPAKGPFDDSARRQGHTEQLSVAGQFTSF